MKISTDVAAADHGAAPWQQTSHARVALLTPYDGGNLGDAAIQDALIRNLRRIDPAVQLSGITLRPQKTSEAHQIPCFPLAANPLPFYHYSPETDPPPPNQDSPRAFQLRQLLRLPVLSLFRKPLRGLKRLAREFRHTIQSYVLLRNVNLLIVAGGGQLDEEWGGTWGHPFALMKWTVLARLAGSSVVFLSVGGCRTTSRLTRSFLRVALSTACYRSYRDQGSQDIALAICPRATGPVVPDLAFSLPLNGVSPAESPDRAHLHVGVSPIAYGHPFLWPTRDPENYKRYMEQLGAFISFLVRQSISVTVFSSGNPDEQIFPELWNYLDPALAKEELQRITVSNVNSLSGLLQTLQSFDFVVASRLHGLLLSFLSNKPSIAISYDRKVQCLMNDLDQAAYCVDIRSIRSDDLRVLFAILQKNALLIPGKLRAIRANYNELLEAQYQTVGRIMSLGPRKIAMVNDSASASITTSNTAARPGK
ncbi:MAG TPA: polysaccharide pyruvyl transferase family protein [Candidatus Eremiobacteraceae bacterium]|nr:polysaccharide pyruvyl transferase family protein [Candidatus Eremiobacteraceae bacterium]